MARRLKSHAMFDPRATFIGPGLRRIEPLKQSSSRMIEEQLGVANIPSALMHPRMSVRHVPTQFTEAISTIVQDSSVIESRSRNELVVFLVDDEKLVVLDGQLEHRNPLAF